MKRVIANICEGFEDDAVNILLGHVTVAGAALGGGERTAQTIFDYWIDTTAFPADAHYVGLGHIHKTQKMPGPSPIHYCGSALQLDFSDKEESKNVLIVEASPGTPAVVTEVPLRSGRRLRTISGTMAELEKLSGTVGEDYLRVFVKEPARTGLGDEIKELFPNVVKVVVESEATERRGTGRLERAGTSPQELFKEYLSERGIEDERMVKLFSELYEEAS
jgi:exonuclease SbcD